MAKYASLFLKLTSSPEVAGEKRFLGEAKDALYRDQIEIDSWDWDLTRASEASPLTKIGSKIPPPPNSVVPGQLSFRKSMCRATAGMLGAMRDGALLKAVFSLEEDSSTDFLLKVTLEDVRITNYSFDIKGQYVSEGWDLNYAKIRFDFRHNYADTRGDLTVTLTRPDNAPGKVSSGSDEEKFMELGEAMDSKTLRPLLTKLNSHIEKTELRGPVPGKLDKVTKK